MDEFFTPWNPSNLDYSYEAAMELLYRDHVEAPVLTGCYTLPDRKLRQVTQRSGESIRPLLRNGAKPCRVHPDDVIRAPLVDILAVGGLNSDESCPLWLALGTSTLKHLVHLTKPEVFQSQIAMPVDERNRCIQIILKALESYTSKLRKLGVREGIGGEHTTQHLRKALDNHTHDTDPGSGKIDKETANETAPDGPGILVVCSEADLPSVRCHFDGSGLEVWGIPNLAELFGVYLPSLQRSFGSGWLANVDLMAAAMKKAAATQRPPRIVLMNYEDHSLRDPGSMGSALAMKMTAYGWLPDPQGAVLNLFNRAASGRIVKTVGGGYTDGDISVYDLPRVNLPDEDHLGLSIHERLKESWLQYQSNFREDRVVFAIECTLLGKRKEGKKRNNKIPFNSDDFDELDEWEDCDWEDDTFDFAEPKGRQKTSSTPRFRLVGSFHISALGIMRRLLPGLRIRMIGYTAAASSSTRSSKLERLSDQYDSCPGNIEAGAKLTREMLRLRNLQAHKRPKRSPVEECLDLDIDSMRSNSACEENLPTEKKLTESNLLSLGLRAMLRRGRTGRGLQAFGLLLVGSFIRLAFGISKQTMANLVTHPPETAVARREVEMTLKKEVRISSEEDPDVLRTSKAKHPLQTIYRDISLMFLNACASRLQLQSNVAEWICSNFRLVCLAPLDHMRPFVPEMRKISSDGRYLPESFQSYRAYSSLFGTEPVDGAIPVSLVDLLDTAGRSLDTGKKSGTRGWLANKISQTSELEIGMLTKCGHVGDFPFADLPRKFAETGNPALLLHLDSRLIVRSIIAQAGGQDLLMNWCGSIPLAVKREHSRVGSNKGVLAFDPFISIFRDCNGMAAAALDIFRKGLRAEGNYYKNPSGAGLTVYFLPGQLEKVFKPRSTRCSLGVWESPKSLN